MPATVSVYGETFYKAHTSASLQSARILLKHLWQFMQPASVLDVGCGRGTWLRACHELGAQELWGFDGSWNDQSQMVDAAIHFQAADLNEHFSPPKVELALSMETAEHLRPASASTFIKSLAEASDMILFSAAYVKQGGTNHLNEQPHSYWAGLFSECGYAPFDLFRPAFWGDENVCFWYRQNAFLYARHEARAHLQRQGLSPLSNHAFMDCIHPVLYTRTVTPQLGVREHLKDLTPSLIRALRRRLPSA